MQRDIKSYISSHPSDEELENYIDNNLDEVTKSKIVKHLIECDECSDVVALVIKYGEKKTHPISESKKEHKVCNNINYQGVLGGLVVASVALILLLPYHNIQQSPPYIVFYADQNKTVFLAPIKIKVKDIEAKNRELNSFLNKLVKTTDMSFFTEFKKAEEYLKNKNFDKARESYNIVLQDIAQSDHNEIEKDKKSILIKYQILLLSIKEKDNESAGEYKDIIKDDIRRLKIKEKSTF